MGPRRVAALTTAALTLAGLAGLSAPADAATASGVVHSISTNARASARAFWTPARMAAATAVGTASATPAATPSDTPTPPPGIPTASAFTGVPTVGALFFTTGTKEHFCTASVVDSPTKNIILTAAHCVDAANYSGNVVFVPEYHTGVQPFGAWPVQSITVAAGWQQSRDPDLDFAFLTVAKPAGTRRALQQVTGGLRLGIDVGETHSIEVIGYNNTDDGPIGCATKSFEFEPTQMEFYCHDFWDGTSGGPWILHFNRHNGTGVVFGDIGGYEQGGDYEWASYSAYYGPATLALFLQTERQQR